MADENQNGCLVVGEGVKLSGNFVVPNSASVSGSIDGDLTAREILVGATGVLKGKVTADPVDVRGEIHENVTSNKALFVRSTGKVIGKKPESRHLEDKPGQVAILEMPDRTPRPNPVNRSAPISMKASNASQASAPIPIRPSIASEGSAPSPVKSSVISDGFECSGGRTGWISCGKRFKRQLCSNAAKYSVMQAWPGRSAL